MTFSGIIDRTSPITLARLLERIYDSDEPGELRLVHSDTKETAVLVIARGEIIRSRCGELTGEAAVKKLASTFPWSYHFTERDAKATGTLESEASQLPLPRPTKRPALKLKSELPPPASLASMAKSAPALPAANLSAWLVGGDDHFIRFAEFAGTAHGSVDSDDWDYFRADYQWLTTMGNSIGQSLGFTLPITMAVAEPQRAAAYGRLEDGFAGVLGGKGAGVAQVLQFDEPSPT